MTISAGERLPEATFSMMTADGPKRIGSAEIFSGKKVVLIGVPGAFTPTCSNNHVPGFLDNFDSILAKGVDTIAVVSVNDVHVMGAWARFSGGDGKLIYLADGNGDFARATGLEADMSAGGMGRRMMRVSMIVDDGVVQTLNIETQRGQATETSAATLLGQL